MLTGTPQPVAGKVEHVVAFELTNVSAPLLRSTENEATLLSAALSTYSRPAGLDDELPQLNQSKLRAQMPTSANNPQVLFDIHSPRSHRAIW
jgi:hypothetical protein